MVGSEVGSEVESGLEARVEFEMVELMVVVVESLVSRGLVVEIECWYEFWLEWLVVESRLPLFQPWSYSCPVLQSIRFPLSLVSYFYCLCYRRHRFP